MDLDDRADLFAILGLAGIGAALMLVGRLDLNGAAIVLAILVPPLAASLLAAVTWWRARTKAGSVRTDAPSSHRSAGHGPRSPGTPRRV